MRITGGRRRECTGHGEQKGNYERANARHGHRCTEWCVRRPNRRLQGGQDPLCHDPLHFDIMGEGQLAAFCTKRCASVKGKHGATVRCSPALDSAILRGLAKGAELEVYPACVAVIDQVTRIKLVEGGWVSLNLLKIHDEDEHKVRQQKVLHRKSSTAVPRAKPAEVLPKTPPTWDDAVEEDMRLEGRSLALVRELAIADAEERKTPREIADANELHILRTELESIGIGHLVERNAASADPLLTMGSVGAVEVRPKIATANLPDLDLCQYKPMVSVILPTQSSRRVFHNSIYRCFKWQTYDGPIELVVLEHGSQEDQPSPIFFAARNDPRLRYHFERCPHHMNLGDKRNWLCRHARGDIVVFFDDDDLYAPTYVARLVAALGSAHALKLSAYFYLDLDDQHLCYFDADHDSDRVGHHLRRWSRGFSIVAKKALLDALPFAPNLRVAEDYDFLARAIDAGFTCLTFKDAGTPALVLHLIHKTNTLFGSDVPLTFFYLHSSSAPQPAARILQYFKFPILDALLLDTAVEKPR